MPLDAGYAISPSHHEQAMPRRFVTMRAAMPPAAPYDIIEWRVARDNQ